MNTNQEYLNVPLDPIIKAELKQQADENARSTGREASLIIDRAMRRRIAKRKEKES